MGLSTTTTSWTGGTNWTNWTDETNGTKSIKRDAAKKGKVVYCRRSAKSANLAALWFVEWQYRGLHEAVLEKIVRILGRMCERAEVMVDDG